MKKVKVRMFVKCEECDKPILVGDEVHEIQSSYFCSVDCMMNAVCDRFSEEYTAEDDMESEAIEIEVEEEEE